MGIGFSGGSSGSLVFAGETILSAPGTTITVNNIATGFRQLYCFFNCESGVGRTITAILNNDSAGNYNVEILQASGASVSSSSSTVATNIQVGNCDSGKPGNGYVIVQQLPSAFNRSFSGIGGNVSYISNFTGHWANTAEVTRVDIVAAGNFNTGSRLSVYGVK